MAKVSLNTVVKEFEKIIAASLDDYKSELCDDDLYLDSNIDFAIHMVVYAKFVDFCARKEQLNVTRAKVYWRTRFKPLTHLNWEEAVAMASVGVVLLCWPSYVGLDRDLTDLDDGEGTAYKYAFGMRTAFRPEERTPQPIFSQKMGPKRRITGADSVVKNVREIIDPPCETCGRYVPTHLCSYCLIACFCSDDCWSKAWKTGHKIECSKINE